MPAVAPDSMDLSQSRRIGRFILPRLTRKFLSPNPPKDLDGVRTALQGRWPGVLGLGGRRTVFSRRTGPLYAGVAMRGMARGYAAGDFRDCGDVGSVLAVRPGTWLAAGPRRDCWVSQGQRRGRCKVRRRAERVIRPTRGREHGPLAQTNPAVPGSHHGPPARRRWRRSAPTAWFSPTPYLRSRMAFSTSAGDWPPVPIAVGMKACIWRRGRCGFNPPDNRTGGASGLERGVSRLGDIGGAVHPGNSSPPLDRLDSRRLARRMVIEKRTSISVWA